MKKIISSLIVIFLITISLVTSQEITQQTTSLKGLSLFAENPVQAADTEGYYSITQPAQLKIQDTQGNWQEAGTINPGTMFKQNPDGSLQIKQGKIEDLKNIPAKVGTHSTQSEQGLGMEKLSDGRTIVTQDSPGKLTIDGQEINVKENAQFQYDKEGNLQKAKIDGNEFDNIDSLEKDKDGRAIFNLKANSNINLGEDGLFKTDSPLKVRPSENGLDILSDKEIQGQLSLNGKTLDSFKFKDSLSLVNKDGTLVFTSPNDISYTYMGVSTTTPPGIGSTFTDTGIQFSQGSINGKSVTFDWQDRSYKLLGDKPVDYLFSDVPAKGVYFKNGNLITTTKGEFFNNGELSLLSEDSSAVVITSETYSVESGTAYPLNKKAIARLSEKNSNPNGLDIVAPGSEEEKRLLAEYPDLKTALSPAETKSPLATAKAVEGGVKVSPNNALTKSTDVTTQPPKSKTSLSELLSKVGALSSLYGMAVDCSKYQEDDPEEAEQCEQEKASITQILQGAQAIQTFTA